MLGAVGWTAKERRPELLSALYCVVMAILAVTVSFPDTGELLFRGYFVQDADEVIRAWYGRCAWENPNIIPYSHLSMPGWTLLLAIGETVGRWLGLPLTLPGRLMTVAAAWVLLKNAASWVRLQGGSHSLALAVVALIAATPGFFLMALTVYPSVMFSALVVTAARLLAEDRPRAAAIVVGFTPLIRWEGVLIIGLFGLFLLLRRSFRSLPILLAPYAVYLAFNVLRFGNPWRPLAWRTTRYFGAWLIWNPQVTWDQRIEVFGHLAMLYSPAILLGGLLLFPRFRRLGPLPWAYAGLTVAFMSIQHDFMVWALRVIVTPTTLGIVALTGVAAGLGQKLRHGLVAAMALATLVSLGMSWSHLNNATVPAEGRFRSEAGFHMFVRHADATEVLDWLKTQEADWVMTNHMNANLLRADGACGLYRDYPLRLGVLEMSLSSDFQPTFGVPSGTGIVIMFGDAIDAPEGCEIAQRFHIARLTALRCTGTTE